MIIQKLRRVHRARPFRPFTIHVSDGRALEVAHPELLALSVVDNTALVVCPETEFEVVDLDQVTSIRKARRKPREEGGGV